VKPRGVRALARHSVVAATRGAAGPRAAWCTDRPKSFFVAFDYTADALTEFDRFFRQTGKVIVALTVREIPDEQLAKKLV
jgi:hypothetical protein